jgi:uncharacterized protein
MRDFRPLGFPPARLAGYWLTGRWVREVTRYYLLSLPVVLSAILLGRALHHRLKDRRLLVYVYIGLIAVGVTLLVQAVWNEAGAVAGG